LESGKIIIPDRLPVINLASAIMVFPGTMSYFFPRGKVVKEIIERFNDDKLAPLVLTMMSKPGSKTIPENLYSVGSVAQFGPGPEPGSVALAGIYRAKVNRLIKCDEDLYWLAEVVPYEDSPEEHFLEDDEGLINSHSFIVFRTLLAKVKTLLARLMSESEGVDDFEVSELEEILGSFDNYDFNHRCKSEVYKVALDQFIWQVLSVLPQANSSEKQEMIESQILTGRLGEVLNLLVKNLEMVVGTQRLNQMLVMEAARRRRNKKYRDTGSGGDSKELIAVNKDGDSDSQFLKGVSPELAEKYKTFLRLREFMSEDAVKSILDSFKRLESLELSRGEAQGSEWTVFMTHIDFMLEIPWNQETKEEADMNKTEKILDDEHYGLDFAKVPILRYLAAKRLNPKGRGDNLLFTGPPGVGKTSLANSIARALGRKLVRLSLGGVRDEAEIRGHRKTYIGALAGQIMQEMRRAGVKNPIFVLDELDKIAIDFRGDPSAALLEVLDPEQNHSFRDHYLDAPFDLSQVLFIATANDVSGIRPALLDRFEPVVLPGYTTYEKIQIAKKFLIPKAMLNVGLTEHKIALRWSNDEPDEDLLSIIKGYTKEAGVRNLERNIRTICRSVGQEYLKDEKNFKSPILTQDYLVKIFGQPRYVEERASKTNCGETIGLAWTPFGGDILYVQSAILPEFRGKELSQTGSLGKVMIESGKLALSLLRIKLEQEGQSDLLKGKSVHIHVPEGAIEKDGPSAGITMYTALYLAIHKEVARPYIAMTGEVTLTGKVLRVGGVKEKVTAAERAGIKEVILPETNRGDLDEVPQSAKDKLMFHFVNHTDQALDIVLRKN